VTIVTVWGRVLGQLVLPSLLLLDGKPELLCAWGGPKRALSFPASAKGTHSAPIVLWPERPLAAGQCAWLFGAVNLLNKCWTCRQQGQLGWHHRSVLLHRYIQAC